MEQKQRIRPGDSLIKFSDCARARFGHSTRWLWLKVKTAKEKGFPQPFYVDGSPHFINREVDEYLARCVQKVAA